MTRSRAIQKQGSPPALVSRIYHSTGSVPIAGQIEISFVRRWINTRGAATSHTQRPVRLPGSRVTERICDNLDRPSSGCIRRSCPNGKQIQDFEKPWTHSNDTHFVERTP